MLDENEDNPRGAALMHFALGKMRDDLGDVERAFAHYRAGNQRMRERFHDPAAVPVTSQVERIMETFDDALFERVRGWGAATERPAATVLAVMAR